MFAALFIAAFVQTGPVVLGQVERDLTGDGQPEILRLAGAGPIDNLSVTLTIEAAGRTLYRFELPPLTRTVGFDAGRRVISADEHRERVKRFGPWFFGDDRFQRPDAFVAALRTAAPGRLAEIPEVIARDGPLSSTAAASMIWQDIQTAAVTIFTFSPGGDEVVAIAWHAGTARFYRLLECC